MSTRKFLDVGTGHLTESDAELLTRGCRDFDTLPMDAMAYEHGWIVSTASLIDDTGRDGMISQMRGCGFSDIFVAIADHAGRKGCWLLRFDRDEDLDLDLPIGGYGVRPEEYVVDAASLDAQSAAVLETLDRLMTLRAVHGDDTDTAASEWRRHLVECERQRSLAEGFERPAFRVCPDWGHQFRDDVPERTVRWVFDRRSWSLANLEILEASTGNWRTATDAERADVEESLVVANVATLKDDPADWGCVDVAELPSNSELFPDNPAAHPPGSAADRT